MVSEMNKAWKYAVSYYFEVRSKYLLGGREKSHETFWIC